MRFVNPSNLPAPLVAAIANDTHVSQGSDIGASALVMPPRVIALLRQHDAEIEVDVRHRMFALWGQAVHVVLERAAAPRTIELERRPELETDDVRVFAEARAELPTPVAGWRVAARLDHLAYGARSRILTDYKVTSVWSVKDGAKPEWIAQLNVTHLVAVLGLRLEPFDKLQVTAMLRDYRKNEKLRYGREYPDADIVNVDVPLWPLAQAQAYVEHRVALHQAARVELPLCTAAERWEKPVTFAVKKRKNKKATRVYDSLADAEQHLETARDRELEIIRRPGESPRCAQYCDALPFCTQGQRILRELEAAKAAEAVPS